MDFTRKMTVLDAADIDAEAAFWAGLLDGTVAGDGRWRNVWIDSTWQLGVQHAPDHVRPTWPADGIPQQIHFDFYVNGVEGLDAAHDTVVGLGGQILKMAPDRSATEGFQVYASPAGHPFCICWLPS